MDNVFDALFQTCPGFETEKLPGFGDIQAAFREFTRASPFMVSRPLGVLCAGIS